MAEVTALLALARMGDESAAAQAFALVYDDLHRLARARLHRHKTFTLLGTTALVNESFLKLSAAGHWPVEDRHHFFAYAAQVMRSVIVDQARARATERRGGNAAHLVLDTELGEQLAQPSDTDVLRVHEALIELALADPRAAQVVELRYFGGLSDAEAAGVLGINERTVRRDWNKARLLLTELLR